MLSANPSGSSKMFLQQKEVIRIMSGSKESIMQTFFKKFCVLPLAIEYLLALILFIIDTLKCLMQSLGFLQIVHDFHRLVADLILSEEVCWHKIVQAAPQN